MNRQVRRKPKRSRGGRPSLPAAERRDRSIQVLVTPEQHAQVTAAAELESQSLASWGWAAFELALARGSTR